MTKPAAGIGRLALAFALGLGALGALAAIAPVQAAEPYNIDVVIPLTGGGAFVGKGQQANLSALEEQVNKTGGIGGRPLHFVWHDDQTSPQIAVQLATELIAQKPAVFLGSSLVAMCKAMEPLVKNGPVMYCLSPGLHPAPGGYAFSASASSTDQIGALIRYYRLKGWTKFAVLTATDATGQDANNAVKTALALPENKDMKLVADEHFNPTDVSVTAQIEHIKASGAQAFIPWITGTSVATAMKGAIQAGLDIPFGTSSGDETFAQMAQYADFLPKVTLMPSGLFPEHDGLLTLDPKVEKVQHAMYATLKAHNMRADNMTATSWDCGLIVVAALRHIGPNATTAQVRDYIANLQGFAGIGGIYDFKAHPERGLGPDSATVVRYDPKGPQGPRWQWVAKPGGDPLPE